MMSKSTDSKLDHEKIEELITTGSEVTGSLSGAVIGLLLAGPAGAILGSLAAPLLSKSLVKVGLEVKNRFLGNREEVKIGAAYTYALDKILERLANGDVARSDTFYMGTEGKRPAAEEILEGALLKAQQEHEELKLKYYGYLIANISFNENINRQLANFLLKTIERLSYRQLCILEIFNDSEKHNLYIPYKPPPIKESITSYDLARTSYIPQIGAIRHTSPTSFVYRPTVDQWTTDLAAELEELSSLKLINLKSASLYSFQSVTLTNNGKIFRDLLELEELNEKDVEGIAKELRYEDKGNGF